MARYAIPPPIQALVVDPQTGLMTAEWYRFLEQLAKSTGGDTGLSETVDEAVETDGASRRRAAA
jgi:hypothetical protein